MSKQQCVGPTGQWEENVASRCPTIPKFRLQHDGAEIWACERHLAEAVTGFKTRAPVAVTRRAGPGLAGLGSDWRVTAGRS